MRSQTFELVAFEKVRFSKGMVQFRITVAWNDESPPKSQQKRDITEWLEDTQTSNSVSVNPAVKWGIKGLIPTNGQEFSPYSSAWKDVRLTFDGDVDEFETSWLLTRFTGGGDENVLSSDRQAATELVKVAKLLVQE